MRYILPDSKTLKLFKVAVTDCSRMPDNMMLAKAFWENFNRYRDPGDVPRYEGAGAIMDFTSDGGACLVYDEDAYVLLNDYVIATMQRLLPTIGLQLRVRRNQKFRYWIASLTGSPPNPGISAVIDCLFTVVTQEYDQKK